MWSKSKPARVLAIDWDQRTVRIVDARFVKKVARIEKILAAPIPIDVEAEDPAQMGAHIKNILQQEGIVTRQAIIDIPRDQAVLNTLKLPNKNPELLPGMVQMQIGKELTFPLSEAAIDFAVPPSESEDGKADVLVAAVRSEVLNRYENTMSAAGLRVLRVGLRPHAARVAVVDLFPDHLPDRVLFVDVRPSLTEIDVVYKGQLAFSRAASVHVPETVGDKPKLSVVRPSDDDSALESGEDATPAERSSVFGVDAVVNSLIMELTRSIEAYRAQDPGARIDKVIVGGDVGVEPDLVEAIRRRLRIEADQYNPAPSFEWTRTEGEAAAAYAATLGLVLGHAVEDALHFDFLHPKKTVTSAERRLKRAPAIAAAVVFFVACLVFAGWYITRDDRRELAKLEAQIASLSGKPESKKKFIKVADHVRNFDKQQVVWIDVFYDMINILPPQEELVLDDLTLDASGDRVVMGVRTKDRATGNAVIDLINDFVRDGREGPRFHAQIRSTKAPDVDAQYPQSQTIVVDVLEDEPIKEKNKNAADEKRNEKSAAQQGTARPTAARQNTAKKAAPNSRAATRTDARAKSKNATTGPAAKRPGRPSPTNRAARSRKKK